MKGLKQALAAIGFAAASCGALAAFPAATNPSEVSVPQLPGGFFIGGLVNYVEPAVTNGDLLYSSTNSISSNVAGLIPPFFTNTFSSANTINPGYDWGWGIYGGYVFPNTGNDVTLTYYHLDSTDDSSVATPGAVLVNGGTFNFITPINIVDGIGGDFNSFANSKASFHINQVDLTAGQLINVGCRLRLHPNAGLRWASVDQTTQANFGTPLFAPSDVDFETLTFFQRATTQNARSNFNGIGPVFGVDATYYVAYGFGAVGHFDTAVLVGNISSSLNTTSFAQVAAINSSGVLVNEPTTVTQSFSNGNTRRVVPVIDAKLGADYTWLFNNSANSDLTLEAGWQFSNYFNAVDYINAVSFGQVTSVATSDVGLQGPYISLTFHA